MRGNADVSAWPVLCLGLCMALGAREAHPHGNVVAEEDACVIRIGFYSAHFSVYQPSSRGHTAYCEDLPDAVETLFVLDYLHESMRQVPVDFRVVRDTRGLGRFARIEDFRGYDLAADTVFYEPARRQGDGVFAVLVPFDRSGAYVGLVTALNPDEDRVYSAVFPFEVDGGLTDLEIAAIAGSILLAAGGFLFWRRRRLLAAVLLLFPVQAMEADASAGAANVAASEGGELEVRFASSSSDVTINRIHSWVLELRDRTGAPVEGATILVSGGMPAHDHGLQTAPRVTRYLGQGRYLLEGLKFHMNGLWRIELEVRSAGLEDRVFIDLEL